MIYYIQNLETSWGMKNWIFSICCGKISQNSSITCGKISQNKIFTAPKYFFTATKLGFFLFRSCSNFHPWTNQQESQTILIETLKFQCSFNIEYLVSWKKRSHLLQMLQNLWKRMFIKNVSNHHWHFQRKWNYFILMIIKQNMKFNCIL